MAYSLQPITLTASATLSKKVHAGTVVNASAAAGMTLTLPASSGDGSRFTVRVKTTVTSNNLIIQVANATDVMTGYALLAQDSADTAVMFETASTSDTITMNGSTKGGIVGDLIELIDADSGFWQVRVIGSATGTEATPFSAAVS
jgi:hypothetical protein